MKRTNYIMQLDQKILQRFDELIVTGEQLYQHRNSNTPENRSQRHQWVSSSLNLLEIVCGEKSVFKRGFEHAVSKSVSHGIDMASGALRAAKDDYEKGFLKTLRTMITAEVFEDFLEQAEYLLKDNYYQPAAVMAGAVLEDGLRKLCERNNITFTKPSPTINDYNQELYKERVYEKSAMKQVDWMAVIRNHAAHGQWDKFEKSDVEKMIPMVRDFKERNF